MFGCPRRCNGFTLLHAAVRFNNPTALSLLLANGAVHVLTRDKDGKTPFDWAILNSEPAMVQAMVECAAAGYTPMPNLTLALKNAEEQKKAALRSGKKVIEADETEALIRQLIEEAERARRAEEAAAAAAAAAAARQLQEELERAARIEAEAEAAAAAREAERRRRQLEAEAQARLEEEARLREEERRRREAEEEAMEAERNARDARTQMIHFAALVEASLLRRGIGKDAPIIVVRVRPLSTAEFAVDPTNMLLDGAGVGFDASDTPGVKRLAPGPALADQYCLGDEAHGYRMFGCNSLQRARDEVYGTDAMQYNDADQLQAYMEVGGTIVDSMAKGNNATVIACGARGAGKSYSLSRPFHEYPFERDEFDDVKRRWTAGKLVKSDESGLVERTGRDLMSYRTVLQANEPSAKLFCVMTCVIIYQEKMYDLLAKSREAVIGSANVLKIVGEPIKAGTEGRGVFVQGAIACAIAPEGAKKKGTKEKSVRAWMMKANTNRRNLAKDLKAGDKELKRACCVTVFEILQLSDVKKAPTKGRGKSASSKTDKEAGKQLLYSSVTLVDLPGATMKPSDDGVKKKEDISTTKMLANLSNCIDLMIKEQSVSKSSGKGKKKMVVPWRSSKLTMLLRDKIGGNNTTIMIGAISPASAELANSRRTLEFLKICGALRQPPIEERDVTISVVPVTSGDPKKKAADSAEKAAAKEKIKKVRKEKRARGEKIFDETTGEELLDDDDLDVDRESLGLSGLLNDPNAMDAIETLEKTNAEQSVAAKEDDARLRAHAHGRKALSRLLSREAFFKSILGGFRAHKKFCARMLELDKRLEELRRRLKRGLKERIQCFAHLNSRIRIYLKDFEETKRDDSSDALQAKLAKLSTVLTTFKGLSDRAARAWKIAQLRQIQEQFDALLRVQAEITECRTAMLPLLKEQREAIDDMRRQLLEELQRVDDEATRQMGARQLKEKVQALTMARRLAQPSDSQTDPAAATEEEDDPIDTPNLECLLHDLGLMTSQIDLEAFDLRAPPVTTQIRLTIGNTKPFGMELKNEVEKMIIGLSPPHEEEKPTSILSKMRMYVGLVSTTVNQGQNVADQIEGLYLQPAEETLKRRQKLEREEQVIAKLLDRTQTEPETSTGENSSVLNTAETEMNRLSEGFSGVIRVILEQIMLKSEDVRRLEERLVRAVAPLSSNELAASRRPVASRLLAVGEWHVVCIRHSDGAAFAWGGGHVHSAAEGLPKDGEVRNLTALGQARSNGPSVRIPSPISRLDDVPVREVAAGVMHTLLLDTSGRVWTCGAGRHGALGHGDQTDLHTPKSIDELSLTYAARIEQVAAGDYHSLVVSSDGNVFSFGWGGRGRLGHGDFDTQNRPLKISVLEGARICQVSAGSTHSLAVGAVGELYAWGCSANGRLGVGDHFGEGEDFALPVAVELPKHVRIWQASAGGSHSLALAMDGAIFSFGNGGHGQLGHGDTLDRYALTPVKAVEGNRIRHIVAGKTNSVVHTEAGELLFFGQQHDDEDDQLVPVATAGLGGVGAARVDSVATGVNVTLVQLSDGTLRAFGDNQFGQLGREGATVATRSTPLIVTLPQGSIVRRAFKAAPMWKRKAAALALQIAWRGRGKEGGGTQPASIQ